MKASRLSDAQNAVFLKQGLTACRLRRSAAKTVSSQPINFNLEAENDGLLPTKMQLLKQLREEKRQAEQAGGRSLLGCGR
ncbi:hypothetical protein [Bradyrhizobium sp. DOA9]|uniref:hypothetical protein n=1 Tax=Bradyrhizobium sp. DOA9 TaxID=1126627 RepID=UPI000468916B|nr:hypothetical protein [Bradyrhizobium sp. DOA9]GAJ37703.1 transposase and inactivated derivatives [Bradyrhizobium sp. DOA9]